jgi:HD-like signal output (HDOD) protein
LPCISHRVEEPKASAKLSKKNEHNWLTITTGNIMSTDEYSLSDQAQLLVDPLEHLIKSNGIDIPMLPEVANKALILAQNPDSDASAMAKLIQSDQSLAGHVMRIANSAAYTPLGNLVSLQQAISRLGMSMMSEIALSAAIGAKFFNTPGFESYVGDIWKHALSTALWAKEIARHCRTNVEVAFLAGLLHSIGRPAILQATLDLAKQLKIDLTEDEVLLLEKKYCKQVADTVIQSWKMPTLVIEAVNYYDDFNSAPTSVNQAALVNAGTKFATHMIFPDDLDKDMLYTVPVLTTLNLYQDEVDKLLEKTDAVKGRLEGLSS